MLVVLGSSFQLFFFHAQKSCSRTVHGICVLRSTRYASCTVHCVILSSTPYEVCILLHSTRRASYIHGMLICTVRDMHASCTAHDMSSIPAHGMYIFQYAVCLLRITRYASCTVHRSIFSSTRKSTRYVYFPVHGMSSALHGMHLVPYTVCHGTAVHGMCIVWLPECTNQPDLTEKPKHKYAPSQPPRPKFQQQKPNTKHPKHATPSEKKRTHQLVSQSSSQLRLK